MTFRPDIEGLRALAVTLVIVSHLFAWPPGGFVGVDLFFVISGFLITGLLVHEFETTGRIDLRHFYVRRIRRILPIALTVLVSTTAAAWLVFTPARAIQTTTDSFYALFFLANWHFAEVSSDYFAIGNTLSPVLPYWSLSVEEQFYVVWPTVILVLGWIGLRRNKPELIPSVIALSVIVSFAWAIHQSHSNPIVAYYSTFTRAWELGAGALLALGVRRFADIPLGWRQALAWGGIALAVASAFAISASSRFPGPWAALPVIAASAVVVGGAGERSQPALLVNPLAGYIGKLSYSLFLWHFPVIVFMAAIFPRGPGFYAACIGAMLLLSVSSYHLVEDPIRRSSWLEHGSRFEDPRRAVRQASHLRLPRQAQISLLFGLFALTAGLIPISLSRGVVTEAAASGRALAAQPEEEVQAAPVTPLTEARLKLVRKALASSSWPDLDLSDSATVWQVNQQSATCERTSVTNDFSFDVCMFPGAGAEKLAMVVGDSLSISWLPAVRSALEPEGWKVLAMNAASCPAVPVARVLEGCESFQDAIETQVAKLKPDLVVVGNYFGYYGNLLAGEPDFSEARQQWRTATARMVRSYSKSSGRVVVLEAPPGGADIRECKTRLNAPSDCETRPTAEWRGLAKSSVLGVETAATAGSAAQYVRTYGWFCFESLCPAYVGATTVYADGQHLAPLQARSLAELMKESLTGAK